MLYSPPREGLIRLTKSARLAGHLPGLTPLQVDISQAMLEIIGLRGPESLLEVHSQADAPDATEARRLLDGVKIEPKGSRLRLLNAKNCNDQHCSSEFTITCPPERPVTVKGIYSAVRLADLSGGAEVETTHARITILNVGPKVKARVEDGIIDYSGHEGSAQLFAGWELNLKFTSQIYAGKVDARATGPVRVLIPRGFATCFKASVAKNATFLCRADINSQITQRERGGHLIYTFGEGTPEIRIVSINGPVVIDNSADGTEVTDSNGA